MIVVVGGGPAGLAAAAALGRVGLPSVVLEQGDAVGVAWRGRYDRLRLNTSRLTSRLPGVGYQRGAGLFPSLKEFVAYLERYARRHDLDLRLGRRVERIDRDDAGAWVLQTSTGAVPADQVIVATGYARQPFIPAWSGRDRFTGQLLHAADYRNPTGFRDRDVLVVGAGCSGMEIAYDLVEGGAARVRLSVRTPPNIVPRSLGGLPGDPVGAVLFRLPTRVADAQARGLRRLVLGDLSGYGLPLPDEGPFARLRRLGVSVAILDLDVIQAIKDRRIQIVPGVEALDATSVEMCR